MLHISRPFLATVSSCMKPLLLLFTATTLNCPVKKVGGKGKGV